MTLGIRVQFIIVWLLPFEKHKQKRYQECGIFLKLQIIFSGKLMTIYCLTILSCWCCFPYIGYRLFPFSLHTFRLLKSAIVEKICWLNCFYFPRFFIPQGLKQVGEWEIAHFGDQTSIQVLLTFHLSIS